MKIRSITCFSNHNQASDDGEITRMGEFARTCSMALGNAGYEIQSMRLATQTFANFVNLENPKYGCEQVLLLEQQARDAGFMFLSIGPAAANDQVAMRFIPEILAKTESVFATCQITAHGNAISMKAARQCAEIIIQNALAGEAGFTNLRFAALANVKPHVPFFPAAYHDGGQPACGLAMECADIVLAGLQTHESLNSARGDILARLNREAEKLAELAAPICQRFGVQWLGFDFSPAPFPTEWCSLAAGIERLGGKVGLHGALAGAAWIADMLDSGAWERTGFNGLMLPVLEDARMADRTKGGLLTSKDLLLYSAVCGTGLDTVPLPGDTSSEQITALLIDIAALSLRLDKPLTARLMPIPDANAGDQTQYEFAYFANGEVMRLDGSSAGGLINSTDEIPLKARGRS